MPDPHTPDASEALLRTIDALAAASTPRAAALALWPLARAATDTRALGLVLVDEDRGGLSAIVVGEEAGEPRVREAAIEDPALLEPLLALAGPPRAPAALPWPEGPRVLEELGARAWRGVALRYEGRALGLLLVAQARVDAEDPEVLERTLATLASMASTALWARFAHRRFERGDRRRDALVELSSVINTSLELDEVLDRARRAIGGIEGHAHSWIALLEPDGRTLRRHDRPADYAGPTPETELTEKVAGTLLEDWLAAPETLVSRDLALTLERPGDGALRERGVRRYVLTALRVGGEVIGAFLFGSSEPRVPVHVDRWLLENIALQLALAVGNARRHGELQRLSARRAQQNVYLSEEIQREHNFGEMVGTSRALREVCASIERVAATDSTVLITGPTGVGKELVARAIHGASRVADQPMVKLNCAAIAEGMVESELFGHERGAFTSAVERRIGRFELAQDGTLFLDEIGELPLAVQTKLLRVLQDGEFERVGGAKTLRSNARILAATNRDLYAGIEKGTFRADLYYRLNVFPIEVPPLDERAEDVPLLAEAFLRHFSRQMGKRIERIAPDSLERLTQRAWPGNVRELRHVVERAVIQCDGPELVIDEEPVRRAPRAPEPEGGSASLPKLQEVEALHIQRALEASGWVVEGPRGAAQALGMKGSTLRFRMRRLGIVRPG